MMFTNFLAVLALLALGAQAAPAKREDSASSSATPTLLLPTTPIDVETLSLPGIPTAVVVTGYDQVLTAIQGDSQAIASAFGTGSLLQLEAALVYGQATSAISPTETQLSVFLADVKGTPVVQVSSIGGEAITLATGTASGFPTTFAGHVFTAAPKSNHATTGLNVPKALVGGALTMLGSIAVGALAVL